MTRKSTLDILTDLTNAAKAVLTQRNSLEKILKVYKEGFEELEEWVKTNQLLLAEGKGMQDHSPDEIFDRMQAKLDNISAKIEYAEGENA